jgi:DNA-binding beta-propeller fold protein YncE
MAVAVSVGLAAQAREAGQAVPVFEVDAGWPSLPNGWVLGQTPGVAVDRRDHIWVLHRPRTVPEAQRAQAAPPLLEFDAKGKFVRGWGGPGKGFDWPDSEHGVFVDYKDNVWIGGSSPTSTSLTKRSDDMLLKFTKDGKFLLQIGGPDKSGGNADTKSVNKPADAFVYPKTNELYVADGYGNRRVLVLDADTGAFKRMWGAFGNAPVDAQPAAGGRGAAPFLVEGPGPDQFGSPTHAVRVSNDELVYVADRQNRRVQGSHRPGSSSRRRSSIAPARPTAPWRGSRSRRMRRSGSCTSPTTATRTWS